MRTAVIYARYSRDAQSEQSIEGQLRVCQQYAKNNDIVIVDTYIDRATTGTNDNRVAFQQMLKDSSKQQWSVVLVYKLDRFSRNKYESVVHKKTLKDNGVKIISAMENIPDTPEGTLMEALLEGFNQYFSEELAQKVNRGIKESWLKGNATGGRHIFGYDLINKKYVINQHEADIVNEVFIKYSQDYKAKAIAESLNEKGYHRINGEKFNEKYILYILHNTKYTGKVTRQNVVYDKIFPQIISNELWQKVNTINKQNKLAPSRKKEIFNYILSGKLVCGNCKHKMSGICGTSHTGARHYYYVCSHKRHQNGNCNSKQYPKQQLEDLVINTTSELLNSEDNIQFLSEKIFEVHKKQVADNTQLKLLINKQKEVLKAKQNIVKAIEQGIITETTKDRLVELETESVEIEFEINKEKQRNNTFLTKEDIENYLRKKVFENTEDIQIRKLIVNTFIREIILFADKIIITYNYFDSYDKHLINKNSNIETLKQIVSAFNNKEGSYLSLGGAPKALRGFFFAP